MGGVSAARRVVFVIGVVLALACVTRSARAIELMDGRLQVHGYVEEVLRGIDEDFKENLDLTQWQTILEVETELDILPEGWGPITGLSAYMGLDIRFDCVWTRGCGFLRNADVYGNRANKLPLRLGNARSPNSSGVLQGTGSAEELPGGTVSTSRVFGPTRRLGPVRHAGGLNTVDGFSTLFGTAGTDGILGTADDPANFVFQRFADFKFGMREVDGPDNGIGTQTLGPWLPKNRIVNEAALRDRPNPFNRLDFNPIAGPNGAFGANNLPYRPAPLLAANQGLKGDASGLYMPSEPFRNWINQDNTDDNFDQNYTQRQLQWNLGASQQQTMFLKELYLDAELFDGRLFMRIGRQTIVYGKTELFTAIDQFNPRDIALSTLPSLEESRIPVWAVRAIYSFYEVGPLEDVRAEVAVNLDKFQPDDLGRCGEPYSPNPVCNKSFGLFAHGITGLGVAGEDRPVDWWNNIKGLQGAARLEWRWDKFSFALTDIYSYTRTPFTKRLTTFERSVDPNTGRPLRYGAQTGCTTGAEPGCLQGGTDALLHSPLNQQLFAVICATTIGFSALDRSVCAQSVFNSNTIAGGFAPVSNAVSFLVAGNPIFSNAILIALTGAPGFQVALNADPADGAGILAGGLSSTLSNEQEALLGCGPFYGTVCDGGIPGGAPGGIDLLNVEASALLQSFPGFEGTVDGWTATNPGLIQPGTVGFQGGPVCTRFVNGRTMVLPGCRGPGDAGYNVAQDGSITNLRHPFTQQQFRSEMAALSYNFMNLLVAFSSPDNDGVQEVNEFNPAATLSLTSCSYARPELCSAVQSFFAVTGVQHRSVRAGGNGAFGRRDMVWAGGGDVALQYQKRNVLGLALDFAEDTTKTNWAVEMSWENGIPFGDAYSQDNIVKTDRYNLVISADRPTFINFLNQNRTFFFNTQWFFSYVPEYHQTFDTLGPFNVLTTFTISTGYFQDRLLPAVTFVYDWKSNSGAALPQVQYRFTENFSATFGAAFFMGRFQQRELPLNQLSLTNQRGSDAYHIFTEQALAQVRDRDEVFFKLRYTF